MTICKPPRHKKTIRSKRTSKAIEESFGSAVTTTIRTHAVDEIQRRFQDKMLAVGVKTIMKATLLTEAIGETIDMLKSKPKQTSGWCDENADILSQAISARNRASRAYAIKKTPEHLTWFKATRRQVKKVKCESKNKWLLAMVRSCNTGLLPGGTRSSNPAAIWAMVTKLKRGADKWKLWNLKNTQDAQGKISSSPAENADNFANFYNNLYDNDGCDGGEADACYDKMKQRLTDREWRSPQMWELTKAVNDLKRTAPGLSGIPAVVWKAMIKNDKLKEIMLEIMKDCWKSEAVPENWL
jgi:hypothetical protein